MNRWFTTTLLALFYLSENNFLAAQQAHTIQMKGSAMRAPLELADGLVSIKIAGLSPQNTYLITAVGKAADFKLKPLDGFANQVSDVVFFPERGNGFYCTALGESVDIQLDIKNKTGSPATFLYLSIHCTSCPEDHSWLKKFEERAAEMANLSTSGGTGASSLITNTLIGGNCFDVSGVTSTGNAASRGTFSNGATNIGIGNGVVLATGNVSVLPGPNNSASANGGFGINSPDDPDLGGLDGTNQFDVSSIEFDFRPTAANVQFDFVFGSEEYCEFVNLGFNDVFGFFISGPGINQNIGVGPGGIPVNIDNINHLINTGLYVNNNELFPCSGAAAPTECQLDGWTTVLTATANLIPCETYHIKLVIADLGDAQYTSAVFLKAGSFDAGGTAGAQPIYPTGFSTAVEGCNNGSIRFTRNGNDLSQPFVINFTVDPSSTATAGVDYVPLVSPIIIPAGQSQITIPVTLIPDIIIEGQESITLLLDNSCSCTQTQFEYIINEPPPLDLQLQDETVCGGTNTNIPAPVVGGISPYTYSWSNGSSAPFLAVNTIGTNTYTVTVTDNCGQTITSSVTVTIQPSPTANLSGSGLFCAATGGSANLNVTMTGIGPWDLTWELDGIQTTQTFTSSPGVISVTESGTYYLSGIFSQNGCPGTVSGSAIVQEVDLSVVLNPTDPTCFGVNNGAISTTVTGGSGPYTYTWSPAASGPSPTNLAPNTYNVTVTSPQGCSATESVTLDAPPLLTAMIAGSSNIDCNNPVGNADLEVNGGTPGYTFNWSNGSGAEDPNFTAGGTFTVTVTDSRGCTRTASVPIVANTTLPTASIAPPAQLNCNVTQLTLNANASSQGAQFTYQWSGPSIIAGETTLQPQINQGGTYIITVTNNINGCTRTASVNVPQNNTPPNAVINTPGSISCTTPTLALSGNGTSTGAGIVFTWSTVGGNFTGGTSTLNPTINQAGTYLLSVTNNNTGCTNSASVTIEGNTITPTAVIAPPNIVDCFSPVITLNGGGSSQDPGLVYAWSGPSITAGNGTDNINVAGGGVYTLVVSNPTNNCTASASVTVVASLNPPNALANVNGLIDCTHPTVTLNGAGSSVGSNFSYEWTSPNGNILSGDNTLNPVVNQGGAYTLVVTNNTNGCTRSVTVNVTQDQNVPLADAGADIELNCYQATSPIFATATTGPGYTFNWTANPGGFIGGQNSLNPIIGQPGVYTLLVTNTATGCTTSDVVQVTSNFSTPDAQIAPPAIITCYVPEIDLNGGNSTQGPDITYQWTTTNGTIVSGSSDPVATASTSGTYVLVLTNEASGCTDVAQVTVNQNIALPIANIATPGNINCQNPTISLHGTGSSVGASFTYQWETSDGEIVSGANSLHPVISAPGTYSLTVTNTANGCTQINDVTVNADQDFPIAEAGPDLQRTCDANTLQIDATSSTTGPGITYQWTASPGQIIGATNNLMPTVGQAGVYTLLLTNTANGCTATDVVEVTNNIVFPQASILPPQQLNCNITEVTIDATNSVTQDNVMYHWNSFNGSFVNGEDTPTPVVDGPGTYFLTITNTDNACSTTAQVNVSQNVATPNAVANQIGTLTCQFPNVQLSAQGSSSGPNFSYTWTTTDGNIINGTNTATATANQPGDYFLTVQNNLNGCQSQATVSVGTNQAFPVADAGAGQSLTCVVEELVLSGAASSQGAEYGYIWSTQNGSILSGGNTLNPVVNAPGTYTLSVVNTQNGCTASANVDIGTNYTPPTAAVAPGGVLSCTVSSLTLSGAGSSAGNQFNYNWLTQNGNILSGNNTLSPSVNAVGTYTLEVTNTVNGCTATATTSVAADASLPIANAGAPDTLTCILLEYTLNGSASSQGSQYSYQWSGPGFVGDPTSLQPLINIPGEYQLVVTNTTNGCTAISAVTIEQDIALPVADAGAGDTLNCVQLQALLDASASGGDDIFSYTWTATNGGNIVSGANTPTPLVDEPGTYNLVVINRFSGCSDTSAVAVNEDVALPVADAGAPGLITCTNTTVTLGGSGSTGPIFEYSWTTPDGNIASGANTLSPVTDAPGVYNLLITNNSNGCTATDFVNVAKDTNVPLALAEVAGELNCVVESLQLSGLNSTQNPTIIYTWETTNGNILDGANTLTPIVDAPGQYTLHLFNSANNCEASSTISVAENLTPPIAEAGNPAVISCQNPVLTLDGNGSSQGSSISYLWATTNGNILSDSTTLSPQVDESGFYQLVVTDASNGCTAQATVQILLDQNTPEADAGASPLLTCAVTSLALDGTASSTGSQFNYAWSTTDGQIVSGANTLTPTIGAPGTYSLLVSNASNGCTSDATVLVNQDIAPPTANAGNSPTLTCTILNTNLNGAGSSTGSNFAYLWTTQNGQITAGSTTLTPTVADPGAYQILVTNTATGCTQTASVEVQEDIVAPNAVAATNGELTCNVLSVPLSGTGSSNVGSNFSYLWTTQNGQITAGETTLNPTASTPGTYNLLVTSNLNGCTQTASTIVPQNVTPPQVNATASQLLTCSIIQINLSGMATGGINGVSYAWSGPSIVYGATTANPTVNAIGTYTLTATDLYNGCSAADPVTVSDDVTPPTIALAQPDLLTCAVDEVEINGNGSSVGSIYSYQWAGPGILADGNTLSPLVNQPGNYAITVSNSANGCTATASIMVTQNVAPPIAQAGGAFELTCSVQQGVLNANGSTSGQGFVYQWFTQNGNILSGASTATPTVSEPGAYRLQVTNVATGCTATAQVQVTENTNYPSALALSTDKPACGGQPGSIVIDEVTGGVGPYLYSIDGGDQFLTANEFGGLAPGTYPLVVQDLNGCEYAQSLTFPVPVEPAVTLNPEVKLEFGASATLVATLNIPLSQVDTIIWSPTESLTPTYKPNEVVARPFRDTEYSVTIVNVDGCEDRATVLVRVGEPHIWAPNVISPSNEGSGNDRFLIFSAPNTVLKINTLQIFDRWGNQLFLNRNIQPNDPQLGWDGRFGGQMMNPAVFVWWADVELVDGRRILLKGDVTLVN